MGMEVEIDMSAIERGESIKGLAIPTMDLPADIVPVADILLDAAKALSGDGRPERSSMLPQILEKINDPNFPLEEVNRFIAIEIALVAQEMGRLRKQVGQGDLSEIFLQKSYDQQVKALQALEKSLTSTDLMRKRDVLHMDGPKFTWLFGEIVNIFKLSAAQALGKDSDTMVGSIMRHFRDNSASNEERLRKQVENIKFTKEISE